MEQKDGLDHQRFAEFVQWGFQGLLLALVTWGVTVLTGVKESIQELNIKMAVVVVEGKSLERRVEKLEQGK